MNRFESFYYQRIKPLFLQKPLYSKEIKSPFFILSSGRSGSTLLRKLLLENSRVVIPPESNDLIPKLVKFYLRYNHKPWDYIVNGSREIFNQVSDIKYWKMNFPKEEEIAGLGSDSKNASLARIIESIYLHYAHTHKLDPGKWGDKTPFLIFRLSWVNLVFPSARFIFLIRDSRAVINSFLQMNKGYTIEMACIRWLKAMDAMEAQQRIIGNARVLFIRYEDLVSDSEKELRKVYSFLELPIRDQVKDNVSLGDDVLKHHQNVILPVTTSFVGKWKNELTEDQIRTVTDLTKIRLGQWGYL